MYDTVFGFQEGERVKKTRVLREVELENKVKGIGNRAGQWLQGLQTATNSYFEGQWRLPGPLATAFCGW